jgi:cytochrome c oxidase cbb3-type subunit III
MSDFISTGWSTAIALVTVLGLVACLGLLIIASRRRVMANDNTTGHIWDEDLKELNNPLPRWWMGLFVLTVVFAALYLYLYPGLGDRVGSLNWSSTGQHQTEVDKANASIESIYAEFTPKDAVALAQDAKAMGIGQRLFLNNCAACHGSDGRGNKGFPNLTDADWLYGGEFDKVKETIAKGRHGVMPAMGAALGSPEDVRNVAQYVLSLSDKSNDSVAASLGKGKFGACAGCHGNDGKGNQALGAPNLTDGVWLHTRGANEKDIIAIINGGRDNQMPAQEAKLTPAQIHVLAAYVLSLSQKAKL